MFGSFFLGFAGKIVGLVALCIIIAAIGAFGSNAPVRLLLLVIGVGLAIVSRFFCYTSAHTVRIRGERR